jgi:hypothetical protein
MNITEFCCDKIPQLRLTADKREIFDFPKLLSVTSFIRKVSDEINFKN